jgi:hypothetical protein
MMVTHILLTLQKATVFLIVLSFLYILFEPVVIRSAPAFDDAEFTVTQEILSEISLTLGTTTVEMTGSIGGILGGTATGTNYAVVRSNSGYTMTIEFGNNPAMLGENTASTGIRDYQPVGAEPDYNFIASTSAVFAYTVASEPSADLDDSFKDSAGVCGSGTYNANRCWQGPSTTPYQVIDRATSTGTGSATTTFTFVVNVPTNPVPAVPADFYTATATLTATVQ